MCVRLHSVYFVYTNFVFAPFNLILYVHHELHLSIRLYYSSITSWDQM
jgi:hypothetical protein